MSLSHKRAHDYLQAAADGLLGVAEQAELQRHLASCSQCRAQAAELPRSNTAQSGT